MQEVVTRVEVEPNNEVRNKVLTVAKYFYFAHLFLAAAFATFLLLTQSSLRSPPSFTLVLVILYGFVLIWLLLFNLFSVVTSLLFSSFTEKSGPSGATASSSSF